MQRKILLTYIILIVVTVIFSVGLSWSRINNYFFERVEKETITISDMLHKAMEDSDLSKEDYQSFIEEYSEITTFRITLIDQSGHVWVDSYSDAETMDNHANRPEVRKALAGEKSSEMRYSNTMKKYFFYYARPLENAEFSGIIRVSLSVSEIEAITTDMIFIILISAILGSLIAMGAAYVVTQRFMKPINDLTRVAKVISEGNYDEKIYMDRNDQIGELATAFNTMTFNLKINMWTLEQKNAELESILTSMSNGLVAVNMDYKIVLYNDRFTKLLNLPEEDMSNRLIYELIRELSIFDIIEKAIEEKTYMSGEAIIHKDGEDCIIEIVATPIFSKTNKNKALATLLMFTDVTQMRKLENIRREFVSNVTHELKTPLTSIKGFVDTLKNGAIKDEIVANRFLDIIDIETDRLSNLIQDILTLSEIETLVGERSLQAFELSEIVDEVMDILPKDKEGVQLIIEVEENLPSFECNRDRMKQLLINIIDNSIKYTDAGYVKLQVFKYKNFLNIIVEDTGIGIKHQHLSRIFERFYRVDKGRTRKTGGTGLGLSIVKHIVELYNGDIDIQSEEGKGTTISIRLPY
ncbi:PAS domain-containing sensor histidine kinase [Petrocella atlantisensis]|uniref:histidine kinase n=1 Tax=Petrocella atlantisensis TaxID=2173034 RepID=A0A3P7SA19_9FIRM|nr:ATP-binding protein [Petrocella atlantisensis]VDN48729.1 PAS domain-containing sensor histidine kinase [Petrocella atlantisensis]